MWPSNSTPRYLPKRNEDICPHGDLDSDVYSSIISNSQTNRNNAHAHQLTNGKTRRGLSTQRSTAAVWVQLVKEAMQQVERGKEV